MDPSSQWSIDALNSTTPNLAHLMADLYICHRHENWVRKEIKGFGAFIVFGVLARMLADVQTNVVGSGMHAQWFSCWKDQSRQL